jgi:hypothetical protein
VTSLFFNGSENILASQVFAKGSVQTRVGQICSVISLTLFTHPLQFVEHISHVNAREAREKGESVQIPRYRLYSSAL